MPKKEDRRLRVGVLGCGPIAQAAHFESCTKARNADLYAICDVATDLLERMARTHAPQKTLIPSVAERFQPTAVLEEIVQVSLSS